MPAIKRVLILSHSYVDPEKRGKLRALAARGLEVTAAVPQRWRDDPLAPAWDLKWERQGGLEVFPIPVRGSGDPEAATYASRPLSSLVRDKRPDLIQVEEEPYAASARQAARLGRRVGVPVVLFTWDNLAHRLPWLRRWRRGRMLRSKRLAGVIAGNAAATEHVRRVVPHAAVETIPQHGVAVPAAAERNPHDGLAVGCFARLVPARGVDLLIKALERNRVLRWTLTVAGEGPERERLEALVNGHRLAARVHWLGGVLPEQRRALWAGLDVVVQPSRTLPDWVETFAPMLVEGMASGVVAVASASGALPEVVGDAGLVFPEGEGAVEALAGMLERLAVDGELRARLAQAGRARVLQQFSDDAVAERTLNFWSKLLS